MVGVAPHFEFRSLRMMLFLVPTFFLVFSICALYDNVRSSREIYEDYAGDFPSFKAIFDVLGDVQHLGSTRFAGAEASLLRYQDLFDNGRQAVQYQALIQFVEVTQKGNWSEAFRARCVLETIDADAVLSSSVV